MLLRASSEAVDAAADLGGALGSDGAGGGTEAPNDFGVEFGDVLISLAEAAYARADLGEHRALLGAERFVEAAATVAVFNGLVRTADASGIPLDDGTLALTEQTRADLNLNSFAGSANTDLTKPAVDVPADDLGAVFR